MKFYKKYVIYVPDVWGGFSSDPFLVSMNSMESPVLVFWGYGYKYHRLADKQKVVSYSPGGCRVPRSPAGATSGEACFLVPRLPAASPCPRSTGAHSLLT